MWQVAAKRQHHGMAVESYEQISFLYQWEISGKVLPQKKSGRGLEIFTSILGSQVMSGTRAELVAAKRQQHIIALQS